MTSNQIKFWELQERKRSNMAGEQETARSNRAKEALTSASNLETMRHNVQGETQAAADLLERSRSNRANEALSAARNALTAAQNTESVRHNIQQEVIGRSQATGTLLRGRASMVQAGTGQSQAITAQRSQKEMERHNQAEEAIGWANVSAKTATDVLGTLGNLVGRVIGRSAK